eukprot:Selendium_serpulae@DN5989_c1_g2_i3.p1
MGLMSGLSVKDIIRLWPMLTSKIFQGNRNWVTSSISLFEGYDISVFKNMLQEFLGHRFLNTIPGPYCFVTATNVSHQPYELFVFRNYSHCHDSLYQQQAVTNVPVWTAVWASSSAPTYLRGPNVDELEALGLKITPQVQFVDGALKANNPAMVALNEAARLVGKNIPNFIEEDLDMMVSVGTGQPSTKRTSAPDTKNATTFQILVSSAHLMMSSQQTHREVQSLFAQIVDEHDAYFRFNSTGVADIPIDAANDTTLDLITKATTDYLTDEKFFDVKRVAKRLAERYMRIHALTPPPTCRKPRI